MREILIFWFTQLTDLMQDHLTVPDMVLEKKLPSESNWYISGVTSPLDSKPDLSKVNKFQKGETT